MTNFGENFAYTLVVTLMGMGIVFLVLILLQYILKGMEIVFHKEKKAGVGMTAVTEEKAVETAAAPLLNTVAVAEDDELVAVITAAVISCLGGNSNIIVRNIRRVDDLTPAWGKVSRTEQMAHRF
jgi:sodium pump decarboxylase gamma subunit